MASSQQNAGTNAAVEVVPLTLHIGAEIRGVDLKQPLRPQQVNEVRDALSEMEGYFLPRPASRPRTACRDGPPVRRADDRPCRVRPCRGLSGGLLGRQKPHRQ